MATFLLLSKHDVQQVPTILFCNLCFYCLGLLKDSLKKQIFFKVFSIYFAEELFKYIFMCCSFFIVEPATQEIGRCRWEKSTKAFEAKMRLSSLFRSFYTSTICTFCMCAKSQLVFKIFEQHSSYFNSLLCDGLIFFLQCPPLVYTGEIHQMYLHIMNLGKRKLLYLIQFNDHLKKHTNVFQIIKLNPPYIGKNYHGVIFYSGGWQQNLITVIEILVIFIRLMLIAKSL